MTLAYNSSEEGNDDAQPAAAAPRGGAAGGPPPQVIRGESYWTGYDSDTGEHCLAIPFHGHNRRLTFIVMPKADTERYSAITDWLNFTFPFETCENDVAAPVEALLALLGPKAAPVAPRSSGKHLYKHGYDFGDSGAMLFHGGNANTCMISLSGKACALVRDWQAVIRLGRDRFSGRITRWDGAVDDYAGAHTVDHALQLWRDGLFGSGGNQPLMDQCGNWAEPDGRGRTIYIGKRKNGKCLRVYEKGMELGAKWHPWVRWELTYGSKGRIVPWEVLQQPGQFVVGAYPKALSWIGEPASRVRTIQKQEQIGYEQLTHYAKVQYGPLIETMLAVEGTAEKVVDKLRREGTPRRLKHPLIDRPPEWIE